MKRGLAAGAAPDFERLAALVGDARRLSMLFALLDGGELPAFELAVRAGVSPQASSAHLRKLLESGLVRARRSGRMRLFSLANVEVARAFEGLAALAPAPAVTSLRAHTLVHRLRAARSCYDHLAGRLGVAVMDAMKRDRSIDEHASGLVLTRRGDAFLQAIGIDPQHCAGRRALLRPCLDWTERRDHLAGSLAAALLDYFLRERWLARSAADHALAITSVGAASFAAHFCITHLD